MHLQHRLDSSSLVVLLQQWTRDDCRRAQPQDVAEQLSQWLSAVDSIKLSRALHALEALPSEGAQQGTVVNAQAMDAFFQSAQAEVRGIITAAITTAKPMRGRAEHVSGAHSAPQPSTDLAVPVQRYVGLQKQMDAKLAALRLHMRQWLSRGSVALRQITALDAVMEQVLSARAQRLWAMLPGHLERRLAHRLQMHRQALQASGQADEPLRWRQPGGWLWFCEQDLQALLLAEMQVRLQPITGLLEAARNEQSGQQA
jgi:hypothetical protein